MLLQAISLESTIRLRWFDKRITLTNNTDMAYETNEGKYLLFNRDPGAKYLGFFLSFPQNERKMY